jgi:uncharacterized protein YndB with AHSA1/START domain
VKVKKKMKISAPREKLWSILTDFDNYGEWMYETDGSNLLGNQKTGMGTRYEIFDEDSHRQAEITHWDENNKLVSELRDNPGSDNPIINMSHEWLLESNSLEQEIGETKVGYCFLCHTKT